MANKCLLRVQKVLEKSSITAVDREEILNQIKIAQAELKLATIDELNVDAVSKEVASQIIFQKKINKRNAIENEIKGRKSVEFVEEYYPENPEQGLVSMLVGTNEQKLGARESVARQQTAATNQLITEFDDRLEDANLALFFKDADEATDVRIARTMEQLAQKPTKAEAEAGIKPVVTEKNPQIVKLATIMQEYSEKVRGFMNDRGANIERLWGWIVRQSHDPFMISDAERVLKKAGVLKKDIEADPQTKGKFDEKYNKDLKAWKEYVLGKLDQVRTFIGVDDPDKFLDYVYRSLVRNETSKVSGVEFSYGSRPTKDAAKSGQMKRVLHFKDADAWSEYNKLFGAGNLKESFYSGLMTAGRNIGMIDQLGTKPAENFEKIRKTIVDRMTDKGRDVKKLNPKKFEHYMMQVDGSIYTVENFAVARVAGNLRTLETTSKLGGATLSAISDTGLYASEMKYQGRSFFGGMFEALSALARVKDTKERKAIAKMSGHMADNMIYEVAGRVQVGDVSSKKTTNFLRTFFKYNLLSWWTNTLKESAMLGMSNYYARQKNLTFDKLSPELQRLFKTQGIQSTEWNVIRTTAMETAENGDEFLNIALLENMTDNQAKLIARLDNPSARELRNIKNKFRSSVSGMLLDRNIYAVLEPDARTRADLTQGYLQGTAAGEGIRFFAQFKAFPVALLRQVMGREMAVGGASGIRGMTAAAFIGMGSIFVTTSLLGYVSMTIKDMLKGRTPRDIVDEDGNLNWATLKAAMMQGGGAGILGDVLFQELRGGSGLLYAIAGPGLTTMADVTAALINAPSKDYDKTLNEFYKIGITHVPFLNLFYAKSAFDYMVGYQMMETMNPGVLRRVENRMEKEYGQEFIFSTPSVENTGF